MAVGWGSFCRCLRIGSGYYCRNPLYITRRYCGTITIIAGDEKLAKDDPFNCAPHEIQNWVKGIAWRDQYFRGRMLDVIAEEENVDVRYVVRMIDQTFEIR